MSAGKPNVVFVFADQWRAQAAGYAGDPNARTPNFDALAGESLSLGAAVAGCPVCSPYRASLLTGRYPLTHGVIVNDVCLGNGAVSLAQAFKAGGYDTAYIGKWHLDGHGRESFIPPERRQGFEHWQALECTHEYNDSPYYGHENRKLKWEGYDAIAQTQAACRYIAGHDRNKPFLLVLSWGPPHNPYRIAPRQYADLFKEDDLVIRPNVPANAEKEARRQLAGYYAHVAALDACAGYLAKTLRETGLENDTIFVVTSDHGDMLGSQGQFRKQRPWDESILVPFLLRWPAGLGKGGRTLSAPFNAPDIMPTLLGLCGLPIPQTVEGYDYSSYFRGAAAPPDEAALIACYHPFGEFTRRQGGREYRGVRTERYTYVRTLDGPWLLFDNRKDPCQLRNLVGSDPALQERLETMLKQKLADTDDEFLPGDEYILKWGYRVDENGTVPYWENA